MPTGIEAVADIATGALLAQTVEPVSGERADDTHERNCLNCGTALIGTYCSACGQKAHLHRTLIGFGHDLLHGVFHFDGKIWRTLPMLAWRPGDLTRRYIHGERAKFVSPLALFLFVVFLTFAIFNSVLHKAPEFNVKVSEQAAEKEYKADHQDILNDITSLQKDKAEKIAENQPGYEWIDKEIARHQVDLKKLDDDHGKAMHGSDILARKMALNKSQLKTQIAQLESDISEAKRANKPVSEIEAKLNSQQKELQILDSASSVMPQDNNKDATSSNFKFTDGSFFGSKKLNEAAKRASENPQLLIYKLQSDAYKFSWALIPISIPFLWLLFFWHRKFKLFDHAVFITYSLCFMMLLSASGALVLNYTEQESAPFVITILALIFIPPYHIYRQMLQAYQTTRFGALWRTFLLSTFAMVALALFASLIILLGVAG